MIVSLPRSRSQGVFINTCPQIQNYVKYSTCAETNFVTAGAPFGTIYTGESRKMTDIVTRGFQKRRAHGEIFMNPMSMEHSEASVQSGIGYHLKKIAPIVCSGINQYYETKAEGPWFNHLMWALHSNAVKPLAVGSVISDMELSDLQKEVSTKALAKRGASDNNLFESIAEYRQAISLLKNPLQSVSRLLAKADKATVSIARSKSRSNNDLLISASIPKGTGVAAATGVSAGYLSIRYGLMPLIRDITGIIKGLEKKIGHMRISARAQGELSRSSTTSVIYNAGVFSHTYGIQTSDSVVVRALSLDEYFVSRAQNIGFASKGLITVPWELIPYSFVIDWFVNLGDYLNSLVPLPALKNLGSCLVTYRARQTLYTALGDTSAAYTVVRPNVGSCFSSVVTKVRTPFLLPGLVVKSNFRFDEAVRVADAIALIVSRMGTVFGRR